MKENQLKKDANSVCEHKDGVLRVDFLVKSTQSQSLSIPKAKESAYSRQKENNHTTYDGHTFQVNKKKIADVVKDWNNEEWTTVQQKKKPPMFGTKENTSEGEKSLGAAKLTRSWHA